MALRVDQVERRPTSRRDPRVEPDSTDEESDRTSEIPFSSQRMPERMSRPVEGDRTSEIPFSSQRIPERVSRPVEADRTSEIPFSSRRMPERVSRPVEMPEPASERARVSIVTSIDPRLADLDPLLSTGSWRQILELLGPPEAIERLPPTLGLIYAVALRESAGDASATPANELAIRSMAAIYGIEPGSTMALVLAKRLLRQNPAAWRSTPAPPAKFSVLLIALALALGGGVGWWLSMGSLHLF